MAEKNLVPLQTQLRHLINPDRKSLPTSDEAFLQWLGGPTLLSFPGRDRSRSRMVVTLLHGNEPSGTRGILRYLSSEQEPATDLHVLIVSVTTALTQPLFSHRQLPGERDMNRCFSPPYDGELGHLAGEILRLIERLSPEAVVDIHNTSGNGPAFSVCTVLTRAHVALTAFFTHRIVVTDLRMGTLIEHNTEARPFITIECGGADGEEADRLSFAGLGRFLTSPDLYAQSPDQEIDLYHHPVRLELKPGTSIAYSDDSNLADVVMPVDIDRKNFGVVTPDMPLAWINNPDALTLHTAQGHGPIDDFFVVRNQRLFPSHPLKLFMVTTNPRIAASDCLLYAVKEMDHRHLLALI